MLFARSYGRAEGIHRAMISRGFQGTFKTNSAFHLRPADILFLAISLAATLSVRLAFTAP